MKKTISLLLALVLCLSLCACGGSDTAAKMSKDELLAIAEPLTQAVAAKMYENSAYAKSLESKTYTFVGKVNETELDYVNVYIDSIVGEDGKKYRYMPSGLYFSLYLPNEELLEADQGESFHFVGKISDVQSVSSSLEGTEAKGIAVIMKDAYIIEE